MKRYNLNCIRNTKISMLVILGILVLNIFINNINNSMNIDKLSISVIDLDKSELSTKLYKSLDDKMKIVGNENINDNISELAKGNIELIIIIEEGYEQKIENANIKELLTVYTGYNPAYSKLLLEIISEETLKTWISYKLIKENENKFNIDLSNLKDLEIENLVEIRESIFDEENSINKDIENEKVEYSIYVILMLILSYCMVIIDGKIILKDKLSMTLKRMMLFSQNGKKKYLFKIIGEITEISFINIIIFSIFFFIRGVEIKRIILLWLLQIIYIIIIKIINLIIIYVSKSIIIYNLINIILFFVNIFTMILIIIKFNL